MDRVIAEIATPVCGLVRNDRGETDSSHLLGMTGGRVKTLPYRCGTGIRGGVSPLWDGDPSPTVVPQDDKGMPVPALWFDNPSGRVYNASNFIGQFVTILSVIKTRDSDGRTAPIFLWTNSGLLGCFKF